MAPELVGRFGHIGAIVESDAENLANLRVMAARGSLQVHLGWFHRYPARFASEVVGSMLAGVLRRLDGPLHCCLDPFAGTGAALAACRQLGVGSHGVELSRLGVTIGRLRLDPPPVVEDAIALLDDWSRLRGPNRPTICPELQWWLGPDNSRVLSALLENLSDVRDVRLRRFATVAISQTLRPASRWLVGSVKLTADPGREPPDIGDQLRRWSAVIAKDCVAERLRNRIVAGKMVPASIDEGDACALNLPDGSVDAVVTSPPYFVTYDYFSVNRLSYLAFNWPMPRTQQVGAASGHTTDGVGFVPPASMATWYSSRFGGEYRAIGRALRAYIQQMRLHLDELHRVLRPGGIVAYAVASSFRDGRDFDLTRACREMMITAGFEDVQTLHRSVGGRRILPAGRDRSSGRFSGTADAGVKERLIFARRP